jgi:glycosyltransferase involved in cell wall biosynthesis
VGKKADAYPLLMKYIHENQLDDRVHFLHDISLEDLQSLYHTARIAAYISNYEGFGIPVIEAFNSNLPILCSNKSSLPEVAGNAALLVDPNNIKMISQGLQTLIFQESEREAYILAMKKQLSLFDPLFLTHQIANLYKGLLN